MGYNVILIVLYLPFWAELLFELSFINKNFLKADFSIIVSTQI